MYRKKIKEKTCMFDQSKHKNLEPTEWFIHLDHLKGIQTQHLYGNQVVIPVTQ